MHNTSVQSKSIFSYKKYWAQRLGIAPFLPMSKSEMDDLGWDACDVILVTGDAYIDHPSFGMALLGRLLEAQGFRVGIISQPDWHTADDFRALGKPTLYFGVTAGNMDSMINHYTADRRLRSDDAYTPGAMAGKRPDRAVSVYAQCCREAFPGTCIIAGGIEASLRRVAHYDYWSDKVRKSELMHCKADILLYGNAERALVELTHRLARGENINQIRDIRGTAFLVPHGWLPEKDWQELDASTIEHPGVVDESKNPYLTDNNISCASDNQTLQTINIVSAQERVARRKLNRQKTVIRLPAYEAVAYDPVLYAHASRTVHLESNPGNARAMVQLHGNRDVWLNPPAIPLSSDELDGVFDLPYARNPHPKYQNVRLPAWEMIRFSVNIMRGCFGGCTFCSITEHEGRIIQSRSEASILNELTQIRDKTAGFTGYITDLGGPTANMYRLGCSDAKIEASCRRLTCLYPDICKNLQTDHTPLIKLYRQARQIKGIKKIAIGSGLRYDLAMRSPEYIDELVSHHVGGYLKIAPEHTESGPLSKMLKPSIGAYDQFKKLFDRSSTYAGKQQYLIPYFIAAHPGSTDEDMVNLALWLKTHGYRPDQVQSFVPTPMALATTMWHTGRNPLKKLARSSEKVFIPRDMGNRKRQKAFLRYHDPINWPLLRATLIQLGRGDLIGYSKKHLVPPKQPSKAALTYQSDNNKPLHKKRKNRHHHNKS